MNLDFSRALQVTKMPAHFFSENVFHASLKMHVQIFSLIGLKTCWLRGLITRTNQLVGRLNAAALEFDPEPSGAAFSNVCLL